MISTGRATLSILKRVSLFAFCALSVLRIDLRAVGVLLRADVVVIEVVPLVIETALTNFLFIP